jgi:hypothetical protein
MSNTNTPLAIAALLRLLRRLGIETALLRFGRRWRRPSTP